MAKHHTGAMRECLTLEIAFVGGATSPTKVITISVSFEDLKKCLRSIILFICHLHFVISFIYIIRLVVQRPFYFFRFPQHFFHNFISMFALASLISKSTNRFDKPKMLHFPRYLRFSAITYSHCFYNLLLLFITKEEREIYQKHTMQPLIHKVIKDIVISFFCLQCTGTENYVVYFKH